MKEWGRVNLATEIHDFWALGTLAYRGLVTFWPAEMPGIAAEAAAYKLADVATYDPAGCRTSLGKQDSEFFGAALKSYGRMDLPVCW